MMFSGSRSTVPSSRYGAEIAVIEMTHWTHEQYLSQPWDLVIEIMTIIDKRNLAQKRAAAAAEAKAKRHG